MSGHSLLLLLCSKHLLLLLTGATLIDLLLAIPWIQVLVDLEPVELQLFPQLLALLVHNVLNAMILLSFLPEILMFLLFDVLVRLLAVPKIGDFFDFELSGLILLCLLLHEVLDRLLKLLFLLPLLQG